MDARPSVARPEAPEEIGGVCRRGRVGDEHCKHQAACLRLPPPPAVRGHQAWAYPTGGSHHGSRPALRTSALSLGTSIIRQPRACHGEIQLKTSLLSCPLPWHSLCLSLVRRYRPSCYLRSAGCRGAWPNDTVDHPAFVPRALSDPQALERVWPLVSACQYLLAEAYVVCSMQATGFFGENY